MKLRLKMVKYHLVKNGDVEFDAHNTLLELPS
jgi:hypothetical protein